MKRERMASPPRERIIIGHQCDRLRPDGLNTSRGLQARSLHAAPLLISTRTVWRIQTLGPIHLATMILALQQEMLVTVADRLLDALAPHLPILRPAHLLRTAHDHHNLHVMTTATEKLPLPGRMRNSVSLEFPAIAGQTAALRPMVHPTEALQTGSHPLSIPSLP
ncbi:hypothetical protein MMC21_007439 [Puttea exsequens]|nr:hypothetical protein [Puttea exsequens]